MIILIKYLLLDDILRKNFLHCFPNKTNNKAKTLEKSIDLIGPE